MRFAPQTEVDELKKELRKVIVKNNVRRICFDPISVLALNLNDSGKIRKTIYDLSSLMKRMNVTTLFVDESLEENFLGVNNGDWTKTDILRFLSDSVTVFYEFGAAGVGDRALRIAKMRRTKHKRNAVEMRITENGIEVGAPEKAVA
jgi:KaiC/GvpD/RAD55 family RecA-like ATPase